MRSDSATIEGALVQVTLKVHPTRKTLWIRPLYPDLSISAPACLGEAGRLLREALRPIRAEPYPINHPLYIYDNTIFYRLQSREKVVGELMALARMFELLDWEGTFDDL